MSEERCPNCGGLISVGADWCGLCFTRLGDASSADDPPSEPEAEMLTSDPGDAAGPLSIAVEAGRAGGVQIDVQPDAPGPGTPTPEDGGNPSAAPDPFAADAHAPIAGSSQDGSVAAATTSTMWQCPVCGHENPIELSFCDVCATPFARLFEEDTPQLDPSEAGRLGLLPGYGHYKLGMLADAFARVVVFLGAVFMLAMFLFFAGTGPSQLLLSVLYLLVAVAVVAESAVDARRLADGERQLVDGRWLIYGFLAVFGISVVVVIAMSVRVDPSDVPADTGPALIDEGPVQIEVPVTEPAPAPTAVVPPPFPSPTPSPTVSGAIVAPVSPGTTGSPIPGETGFGAPDLTSPAAGAFGSPSP